MDVKIITMIGSMRFYDKMLQEEKRLSALGYIVIHPVDAWNGELTEKDKEIADAHINKGIDIADMVYVMDVDGYIGKSTTREIEYAKNRGKRIIYYSLINCEHSILDDESKMNNIRKYLSSIPSRVVTLVGSKRFVEGKSLFDYTYRLLNHIGLIVNMPAIFNFHDDELEDLTEYEFDLMDVIHDWKINHSIAVIVVDGQDEEKYIGKDTQREIDNAVNNCIPVYKTSDGSMNRLIDTLFTRANVFNTCISNEFVCNTSAVNRIINYNARYRLSIALIPEITTGEIGHTEIIYMHDVSRIIQYIY